MIQDINMHDWKYEKDSAYDDWCEEIREELADVIGEKAYNLSREEEDIFQNEIADELNAAIQNHENPDIDSVVNETVKRIHEIIIENMEY